MRSRLLAWPRLRASVCGAAVMLFALPSPAQVPVHPTQAAPESREDGARKHFERALELYRAGRYAEALPELQSAADLDPNGKDLFFNLSLVHEKLGQLPDAISALERFRELETDPSERERARLTIERLHGAEQAAKAAPATPPCVEPPPAAQPPARRPSAVLIGAASVTLVSLVVGTVFGIKALDDDVAETGTSKSLSIGALRERARRAEREALVADVAFAVGAASAGTFVGVWLLSPTEGDRRSAGITLRSYF